MPNMDRILFVVRVDYLLDDGKVLSGNTIKEYIDIKEYEKIGKCRSKCNSLDKAKFPNAKSINPLIRRKKSKIENVINFIVQPGILQIADSFKDMSAF